MQKHNLSVSTVLSGPKSDTEMSHLKDATNDIASQAFAHLTKAEDLFRGLHNRNDLSCRAFHQLISAHVYLAKLKSCDFDPFSAVSGASSPGDSLSYQLKLLRSVLTKTI
jgi:hypothetical protein